MNIDDKLNELENQIKAQNQAVESEVEIHDRNIEEEQNTQPSQMNEAQANALINTIKNPENTLGLHLSKSITEQVQNGAGKERLDKTAGKIIESGLKTFETEADTKENEANKTAEEVYFESKQVQLNRGGIKKATTQRIMTRVVKTDDLFSDINFYLFSWWIIAINNYVANLSNFPKVFRVIVHLFFTLPYSIILICTGTLLGAIAYIVKSIYSGIKNLVTFIVNKIKNKKVKENGSVIEVNREEKEETTTIHRGKNKH